MNMYKRLSVLIDHLIWVILAAVFIFFFFQSEHFLSENNISNIFSARNFWTAGLRKLNSTSRRSSAMIASAPFWRADL